MLDSLFVNGLIVLKIKRVAANLRASRPLRTPSRGPSDGSDTTSLVFHCLYIFLGDNIIQQTTGLLLLLPFLFPGVYQVNKHWKPTKSDVLDSFIFKVDTEADVQDGITRMREHLKNVQNRLKWENLHLQPFVLVVGTSWTEIDQAHIVLDQIIYSFPSVLEAVEVCFQLFHSFHAQYPLESHNVWEFIQQAVYNIYTKFDWNHRSTSELAEQLGLSIKRTSKNEKN